MDASKGGSPTVSHREPMYCMDYVGTLLSMFHRRIFPNRDLVAVRVWCDGHAHCPDRPERERPSPQGRRGGPGPLRFFFAGPGPQEVLQRPWGLHVGGCAGGCVCVCALSPCWHLEVPHGDRAATSILVSDPVPEGKLQRVRFKGFPECLQSPPSESTSGGLCSSN